MASNMFAREYTPEVDEELIARLTRGISQRGELQRGRATRGALERGLSGDPFEASARGLADAETSGLIADMEADFAYRRAGLQREERLIGEGQQFSAGEAQKGRDFSASESEKDRQLRRYLGDVERESQREQSDDAFTQALIGAGGRVGGMAGYGLGKKYGYFG